MWLTHEVQAAAVTMSGRRVASVQPLGAYACRNVVANKL